MKCYRVEGMTCASCQAHIEKAVKKVKGVDDVSVSLLTNSMNVEGNAKVEDVEKAVEKAGYKAFLETKENKSSSTKEEFDDRKEEKTLLKRLIWSTVLMLILMYFSMGVVMWSWPCPSFLKSPISMGLLQLLFTISIMVINQHFFISGFKSLIHLAPNMDSLVALGSSSAFIYSVYALFMVGIKTSLGEFESAHHYVHDFYFEGAAMILTLITLGKYLEAKSKGKTTNALKGLLKLAPKTALLLVNGEEKEVKIEEVKVNDIFIVKPGSNIPVDGVVIKGESAVNESSLTGESIPVDKEIGDKVYSATINTSGYLECRATNVGEDTTLSKIIKMVSDASSSKAPIAKIADKVSGIFVPSVMGVALITLIVWLIVGYPFGFSLSRAIAVLVISCPCALGLATPVAIMVGNGLGAKNGILFKTAVSLETAGKTNIVVLDKTGTITKGEPSVSSYYPSPSVNEETLFSLASSLEMLSEHPLSKAIINKAKELNVEGKEVKNFKVLSGNGLEGEIDNKSIIGGSFKFISSNITLDESVKEKVESLALKGETPLLFSYDGALIGIISVSDQIKEDSPKAINELKNMGLEVVMLTGDNEKTANAIGKKANVDKVIASVLPEGKERVVASLMKEGNVMMVGDGINDAPALTRATTGVAIGAGTDIAIDAADIVLVKSNLLDVASAIRLSRRTLLNIYENLFWAFGYNIIGIPLAAGVFYKVLGWGLNPMFAAAAMSVSSFLVVTNALRLNAINIHSTKHDRKIKNTIKKKYKENKMEKVLTVEGMMCAHCEATVKGALEEVKGVKEASANKDTKKVTVTLDKKVNDSALKKAVESKGYKVISIE